jgi:hypothetical protein
VSPLSSDDAARSRQLANLRAGAGAAGPGNHRAMSHGGHSAALIADVEAEVLELMSALGAAAPVKEADGSPPAADMLAIERAARALKRWRHLSQWCDLHGRLQERTGKVKPAAELELKAERELTAALEALGMTTSSRAKLASKRR